MDRRGFLKTAALASAGLATAPAASTWLKAAPAAADTTGLEAAPVANANSALLPFAEHYTTNVSANTTIDSNAAMVILSGMAKVWKTGASWNDGKPLMRDVVAANVRYCAEVTHRRTAAEAKKAFIYDRQHQSYAVIDGLGPLAGLYRTGAKAVTSITSAPDGVPPATVDDAVPADAAPGSALGAGSTSSDLGQVVQLVNTLRGSYSSGNPAKYGYQYPRPWRLNARSEVVDTGRKDDLGYPVYESDVVVAPQLLRQRNTSPADDGGYVSGHTNAFFLAGLALAYAVPERFQELVTRVHELADTRILAGMHSPLDVIGGRILATALAAAILDDPANATLKAAARSQAADYFRKQTGTDALYGYAHSGPAHEDAYRDRAANARAVAHRQTYGLPRHGGHVPMRVPKSAEVLLETRLPYLDAAQRREVLRTTALPAGNVLLDGPEMWGRLDLFTAADGYAAFERDVTVRMDASHGGFHAADTWRNDIDGRGRLTKRGTGTLTLAGQNRYLGGTRVEEGTLVAASTHALGRGDVTVRGGTLAVDSPSGTQVHGDYVQSAHSTLAVTLTEHGHTPLTVSGSATLGRDSVLEIRLDDLRLHGRNATVPVIAAHRLRGRIGKVKVHGGAYHAEPVHTARGLSVRITTR